MAHRNLIPSYSPPANVWMDVVFPITFVLLTLLCLGQVGIFLLDLVTHDTAAPQITAVSAFSG